MIFLNVGTFSKEISFMYAFFSNYNWGNYKTDIFILNTLRSNWVIVRVLSSSSTCLKNYHWLRNYCLTEKLLFDWETTVWLRNYHLHSSRSHLHLKVSTSRSGLKKEEWAGFAPQTTLEKHPRPLGHHGTPIICDCLGIDHCISDILACTHRPLGLLQI